MKRAMVLVIGLLALAACESPPVSESRLQSGGGSSALGADSQIGRQGLGGGPGSGAGTARSAAGAAEELVRIGDRVFFDTDRYDLRADARATLDKQALWLKQVSQRILVEGHSDERGTREYNLALGDRRARSVKDYLVNQGISAERISTISYGKERLAAMGGTETSWQQNRRGVTVLVN